ncbi:MAG: lysophospholipid acyltransferase family protein [Paracoccaceae bacterium]
MKKFGLFTGALAARGLFKVLLLLPYDTRIRTMGWLMSRVVAFPTGLTTRIRKNLQLACPELPEAEVKRLCRAVPDNAGRTLMEFYSGAEFVERAKAAKISGPGLAALEEARAEGQPVILVTGHFANYDVCRAHLIARGHNMGALYRKMSNPYFNPFYVKMLSSLGTPIFERGRRGMIEMVRHLRGGGVLGILTDLHAQGGTKLKFFGQQAITSTVTAELSLKYNAVLIPIYAIRQPNGLDFEITVQEPIKPTNPVKMTQEVNDGLEKLVRSHMDQWFWIHRRWKPK